MLAALKWRQGHAAARIATRGLLDASPPGEARPRVTVLPPVAERGQSSNQPEKGADQVNPYGMLHALNVAIAFRVLANEQLHSMS